jgi:hypothetical protein
MKNCKVCHKPAKLALSLCSPVDGYSFKLMTVCCDACADTIWKHYTEADQQGKHEGFKQHYDVQPHNVMTASKEWMRFDWDLK